MNSYPRSVLKLLVAAIAVLAFPAAALSVGQSAAVSQSPPKAVVGAGTIIVPTLLVRKAPNANSSVIARMSEFRPQDYRPRAILAIGKQMSKPPAKRKPGSVAKVAATPQGRLVQDHRPRPAQRPHGLGAGEGRVDPSDALAGRRPPRLPHVRALEGRQAHPHGQGRGRRAGHGDAARPLLRHRPLEAGQGAFLGAFAFELSGYSKLSDWPGGGVVGLHGWNDPSVFGRAVSHGCIRVSNENAAFLRDRIPVGTPLRVVAN